MRFNPAVHVWLRHGTLKQQVTDPERAADILLNDWPKVQGPKHLAARKAVMAALERTRDHTAAVEARKAFEAAAEEAGILADRPAIKPAPKPGT